MRYTGSIPSATLNMRNSVISQQAGKMQMKAETSLFESTNGFRGANRSVIHNSKDTAINSPDKKQDLDHVSVRLTQLR